MTSGSALQTGDVITIDGSRARCSPGGMAMNRAKLSGEFGTLDGLGRFVAI